MKRGPLEGLIIELCSPPPATAAATGDIPAYQLRSPNSGLAHSIVMAAASPSIMQSPPSHHAEEITRKREVRLMKNRWEPPRCLCLQQSQPGQDINMTFKGVISDKHSDEIWSGWDGWEFL